MTPFLTAVWSDLILMTYAVPESALAPYLPPGVEPDLWEGNAQCSLVGFSFAQARVLGWSVPFPPDLCDFPEFNLRVYVRQGNRRGVVFVRELVPSPIVAGIARAVYNEPYSVAHMTARATQIGERRRVRHDFSVGGRKQMMAVTGIGEPSIPGLETQAHWLKEQDHGFGRLKNGRPTRYRVQHPPWRAYPIESYELAIDFAHLYGPGWAFLQERTPDSVLLAEGSHVAVYPNEI